MPARMNTRSNGVDYSMLCRSSLLENIVLCLRPLDIDCAHAAPSIYSCGAPFPYKKVHWNTFNQQTCPIMCLLVTQSFTELPMNMRHEHGHCMSGGGHVAHVAHIISVQSRRWTQRRADGVNKYAVSAVSVACAYFGRIRFRWVPWVLMDERKSTGRQQIRNKLHILVVFRDWFSFDKSESIAMANWTKYDLVSCGTRFARSLYSPFSIYILI